MNKLRYPAVPLITVDPYFSVWSCTDKLYDDVTRHWTGRRHSMLGLIELDGKVYRFMGKVNADNRYHIEPTCLEQTDVKVYPMRTVYTFENDAVRLTLTFMTPLLLDDLKLMSRPVSYISYRIESLDGEKHSTKLYFGLDCEIAVNEPHQTVKAEVYENGIRCGRGEKDILCGSGDDRNIEWGWLHLFSADGFTAGVHNMEEIRKKFRMQKFLTAVERVIPDEEISLSDKIVNIYLEKELVVENEPVCGFVCAAYDDIHSIMYFGKMIDAYYKKDGDGFEDVCKKAIEEYPQICQRVEKAEKELIDRASAISSKYCDIVSLAYRQAIAAHKLTYSEGEIQFLSKECFSNGCIGTLDVTYPSIPLFLMKNPALVEGMLNPLFKYAYSDEWEYDFAPHDAGQYPLCNGQVYGAGRGVEMQMPVEESGNAILCVYAICHFRNDNSYFVKHKALLGKWVKYLIEYGLDPENQLCTDDFAGHLAHNCNLSVKAIMGIAAYGKLLERTGDSEAGFYLEKAREYAANWEKTAIDGDHYRLAFDKADTWSIKYNMVWDKLFGWSIFSSEVFEKEISYYMTKFNTYGLPLDSRSDYTKSDWQMWSVCMTDNTEYRDRIIAAMWDMLNETQDRVPFTDWYFASTARQTGFQNRTVQGGLFMPMLQIR